MLRSCNWPLGWVLALVLWKTIIVAFWILIACRFWFVDSHPVRAFGSEMRLCKNLYGSVMNNCDGILLKCFGSVSYFVCYELYDFNG